jgi:hypothetical protein
MRDREEDGTLRFRTKPRSLPDLTRVAVSFQPQQLDNQCLPAALKAMVDEYRNRDTASPGVPNLSLGHLGVMCGFKFTRGVTLDNRILAKEMNRDLQAGRVMAKTTLGDVEIDSLIRTVNDDRRSFPVVTLAPSYFTWSEIPYRTAGPNQTLHHSVLVLGIDENETTFYDPMLRYLKPKSQPLDLVLRMPRFTFRKYWDGSGDLKDVLWLEPSEEALPV